MSVDKIRESLEEKTSGSSDIDFIQLIEQLGIIGKIAGIVIGFLTTIILIIVPIITALEIAYIAFPVVRGKVDDTINKHNSGGITKNTLGFTFRDAREAVRLANIEMIGKESAILIYAKLKCKSLMFVMFIVALVLMGSSTIINFVWRLIDNIIAIIS